MTLHGRQQVPQTWFREACQSGARDERCSFPFQIKLECCDAQAMAATPAASSCRLSGAAAIVVDFPRVAGESAKIPLSEGSANALGRQVA